MMREFSIKNDLPPILPPMHMHSKQHTFSDQKPHKRLNQSELGHYPVDILAESNRSIAERQASGLSNGLKPLKIKKRKQD